jgi:hypothetical protein
VNCLGLRRERDLVILCGAETTNGLALCELCQRKTKTDLEFLPVYFRNLARWQPGATGRSVPGSREPRTIGTGSDRVSHAMDEAGNALTTWARTLADDRPQLARLLARLVAADLDERTVMAWLCLGFDRYLTSVATLEWCGQFVLDVADHEERLRTLTLNAAPGWYAGECRRCTHPTYVVPGLTWVTCGGCGVTTYARDHLETVLDEARTWVARPMRLAEAIVALVDTELSVPRLHKRVSKWGERGRIEVLRKLDADGDEVGPKRFRLGDVLDTLATEGETRLDDEAPLDVTAC